MKNILNIGGAIAFLAFLLMQKKEKEFESPPIIKDPEIIPPVEMRDVFVDDALLPITNASLSPTLTTYEMSDTDKILYALKLQNNMVNEPIVDDVIPPFGIDPKLN